MSRNFGMRIVTPDDGHRTAIGDPGGFDPGPLAELDRGMCTWWHRWLWRAVAVLAVAAAIFFGLRATGHARDDGRWANSPLKPWFDQLASGKGLCCSFADGLSIPDVDWDTDGAGGHYRVRLDGVWIDVPDDAVVTEPNRDGRAFVWPYQQDGVTKIRCFLPGAGA